MTNTRMHRTYMTEPSTFVKHHTEQRNYALLTFLLVNANPYLILICTGLGR